MKIKEHGATAFQGNGNFRENMVVVLYETTNRDFDGLGAQVISFNISLNHFENEATLLTFLKMFSALTLCFFMVSAFRVGKYVQKSIETLITENEVFIHKIECKILVYYQSVTIRY